MLMVHTRDRRRMRLEAVPPRDPHRRPIRCAADEPVGREGWTPSDARHRPSQRSTSPLPTVLNGVRVLIVDDDPETVELFAVVLAACGAEIATATSARDALRLLGIGRPDVILSDIAMPDGDGYWLVREIRGLADSAVSATPVVAATAYGREHSRARVLGAGFAEHLQKPVDPEVLCRTLARVVGRG
jgi:CheY-like chemotaxis protein